MQYDLEAISRMTFLTTRTLRNYMKAGMLKGHMENGKWYFTSKDLEEFFKDSFVQEGLEIKFNGMIKDFLNRQGRKSPAVCTIYDIPGEEETVKKVCDTAMEYFNRRQEAEAKLSYQYDIKEKRGRFIMTGTPRLVGDILKLLEKV